MNHATKAIPISNRPSVHTYFDVIPESPDGQRVTWFAFDGKPLVSGEVMITNRSNGEEVTIARCAGAPHCGASQGWLDAEHVYFSSNGEVNVADVNGTIVQRLPGSIDTINQPTRRGLTYSLHIRKAGGTPPKEGRCWRVDVDKGELVELLDVKRAHDFLSKHVDLTGLPPERMMFQHAKWAPDGRKWFVVFKTEGKKNEFPELPWVKVMLAADDNGDNLRLIGDFGHHPNWLPDSSGIYGFGSGKQRKLLRWDAEGGPPTVMATTSRGEGHPCVSPDGRWLAHDGISYENPDGTGVLLHDLSTGESEELFKTPMPRLEWQKQHPPARPCHCHPVWSPDGKRLYFNGVENELPKLFWMELNL